MAMEVGRPTELGENSVVSVSYGQSIANNDCRPHHSPLSESNDNDVSDIGDDNFEERFRVDRRKLEQLIQGWTWHLHALLYTWLYFTLL